MPGFFLLLLLLLLLPRESQPVLHSTKLDASLLCENVDKAVEGRVRRGRKKKSNLLSNSFRWEFFYGDECS